MTLLYHKNKYRQPVHQDWNINQLNIVESISRKDIA